MPALLAVTLLLCSLQPASLNAACPDEMPRVLLSAPVNATWAANAGVHWRAKGVDGLILSGLCTGIEPGVVSREKARLRTRLAQDRLAEAGVGANFLRVPFAPEAPWFADAAASRRGLEALAEAAAFARDAGLRGLVLDTRPDGLVYQYGWDGYRLEETPPEALDEGARRFGRQAARTCLRVYPQGEVLVLADPFPRHAPLWYALFQGLLEGPGAAEDVPVHVLVGESSGVFSAPGEEVAALARAEAALTARLTPAQRAVWARQGALCLGLSPIRYARGLPSLPYALEAFRARLCIAKALSGAYAWIDAPDGGWWEIAPAEVADYAPLLEAGAVPVLPTPPVPGRYGDYVLRTPVDGFERVGTSAAGDAVVLRDGLGAALLLPRGLPEGYEQPLQSGSLPVTNLYTYTRHEVAPQDGRAVVAPIVGPLLVERLPLAEQVLPACLWMETPHGLTAGTSRAEMALGLRNRTGQPLAGRLEAFGTEHYSVGTASFPLRLAPGESFVHRRAVQGLFREGDTPAFRLVLTLDGGGSAAREFPLPVRPAEAWVRFLDAPVSASPAVSDVGGTVAALTARGGLWMLDAEDGTATRLDEAPVHVARWATDAAGDPVLAAFGAEGRALGLDPAGDPLWRQSLDHEAPPRQACVLGRPYGEADLVVAAFPGGSVEALPADGARGWRREMGGAVTALATLGDGVLAAVEAADRAWLACFDVAGKGLWEAVLEAPAVAAPVVVRDGLAVALADGTVRSFDPETGAARDTVLPLPMPARELAGIPGDAGLLVVVGADRAAAVAPDGTVRWSADIATPRSCAWDYADGAVLADADGALYLAREDGLHRWTNPPGHGPLTGAPVSVPGGRGRPPAFFMSFADDSLRRIEPRAAGLAAAAPTGAEGDLLLPDVLHDETAGGGAGL